MTAPQSGWLRSHGTVAARTRRPVVLGTGLVALDVILSPKASRSLILAAGGTCGNVLTALSFLGWEAFPVARLNGDKASRLIRRDLRKWNVRLDFVDQAPRTKTPIIVHRIRRDATHGFSKSCPECGTWFPSFTPITTQNGWELIDRILSPMMPAPRVFFFDRVSRAALLLADACAARGALIVFEPSSLGDPKLFDEAIARADIMKYACDRLPRFSARRVTRTGPVLEIETLGAGGLRYRARNLSGAEWRHLPAIAPPAVADTGGAGDWCMAALLSRLGHKGSAGFYRISKRKLKKAFQFAQATAALACAYEGARGVIGQESIHQGRARVAER
jgi:fructokinase